MHYIQNVWEIYQTGNLSLPGRISAKLTKFYEWKGRPDRALGWKVSIKKSWRFYECSQNDNWTLLRVGTLDMLTPYCRALGFNTGVTN